MNENYKTYTLIIKDRHGLYEFDGYKKNGTNFVSDTQLDTLDWPEIFSLYIKDEETGHIVERYEYARIQQQVQYSWDNDRWYIAFAPVSDQEVKAIQFKANLEYLAMMSDVDIDF